MTGASIGWTNSEGIDVVGAWLQAIVGTAALVSLWIFFTLATRRDGNPDTPDNRSRRAMRYTVAIIMLGGVASFYLALSLSTALGWSKSTRVVVFVPALIIVIVVSLVVGAKVKAGPTVPNR
jgi:uncharacterized membrane protein